MQRIQQDLFAELRERFFITGVDHDIAVLRRKQPAVDDTVSEIDNHRQTSLSLCNKLCMHTDIADSVFRNRVFRSNRYFYNV